MLNFVSFFHLSCWQRYYFYSWIPFPLVLPFCWMPWNIRCLELYHNPIPCKSFSLLDYMAVPLCGWQYTFHKLVVWNIIAFGDKLWKSCIQHFPAQHLNNSFGSWKNVSLYHLYASIMSLLQNSMSILQLSGSHFFQTGGEERMAVAVHLHGAPVFIEWKVELVDSEVPCVHWSTSAHEEMLAQE